MTTIMILAIMAIGCAIGLIYWKCRSGDDQSPDPPQPPPETQKTPPDTDDPAAVVLFSESKGRTSGWRCSECGIENRQDAGSCVLCGKNKGW